ncbi:FtsQ-type POTRA domain-containing protein [Candidatus Thiothrix sp. Deng01]|uniref:Cell division protein FtsQ n=1 Tax=Candidatus Thiothrix phosphatis TaxID=3112415 RepID=A0ABU6CZ60_9GAMM|nr:FtsQ-type POTRA domain-containing protein [Candidatus Thiothrix sp. Deng01]MEB4592094.1 FtsQ-type POTRA domain-containing protein [Candidatus Thiothrix sp. Deng01]
MAKPRRKTAKHSRPDFRLTEVSPRLLRLVTVFALALVLLGAVLGARAFLNNPENLSISRVDVQGERKFIKDTELQAVIEKYTHTNLYLLDTDALEADLETLPWVRAVNLRKAWPDQLIVSVEEQHPVAFWGKERLMNQYGELFAADLPAMRGIFPTLYSPEDKGREMGERYIQVKGWLKGLPLEISELTEDEGGSWRLKIKGGPEVLIGNENQERRIERFKVGFQRELASKLGNLRRVDLRYTNGFAVEWKQSPIGSRGSTGGVAGVRDVKERA